MNIQVLLQDLQQFVDSAENRNDAASVHDYVQELKTILMKHLAVQEGKLYEEVR